MQSVSLTILLLKDIQLLPIEMSNDSKKIISAQRCLIIITPLLMVGKHWLRTYQEINQYLALIRSIHLVYNNFGHINLVTIILVTNFENFLSSDTVFTAIFLFDF